jgi:CheY-like chemotaxis protein
MITVSDTDTGMARDVRDRIFEPFFTTKQQGEGTGLGLSMVHGIIEQSGGHIFVYSELGFGTTFKIYLPLYDAAEQAEPEVRPAQTEMGGKESILLVEDEESVRRVAAMILSRGGYTVIEADTGAAALQLCERDDLRIDLVVTDVVMPHMGGRDLAREIRRRRPGVRIAFMSGYTRTTLTADDLGEDSVFIEKPFSSGKLLDTIRALIDSPTRAG